MVDSRRKLSSGDQGLFEWLLGLLPAMTNFRNQISLLRWLIPVGLLLLVIVYEIGPARWINDRWGYTYHMLAEILVFGTVGPALAFIVLDLFGRWLDERDTSDFQSLLLARAREEADKSRQLNDDALQVLFSAGTLLDAFKSDQPELSPGTAAEIDAAEQALDAAVQRLRSHLLNGSPDTSS